MYFPDRFLPLVSPPNGRGTSLKVVRNSRNRVNSFVRRLTVVWRRNTDNKRAMSERERERRRKVAELCYRGFLAAAAVGGLASRQAGKQASSAAWLPDWLAGWRSAHPLPTCVTQIINLAMFSRTFECGFRLRDETPRAREDLWKTVREPRVQPYLPRGGRLSPSKPPGLNQNGRDQGERRRRRERPANIAIGTIIPRMRIEYILRVRSRFIPIYFNDDASCGACM